MAMNPEQIARLMSGLKSKPKAALAGVEVNDRQTRNALAYVDAHNSAKAGVEARLEASRAAHIERARGQIALPSAPRTLELSGLTADGFQFDDSQTVAIRTLIGGRHVCLIGAAGTGKTTMVKHALAHLIYGSNLVADPIGIRLLAEDQGPSIAICAFTAIATQVIKNTLPEWLQPACKTIHTLLEYKPSDIEGQMFHPTRTSERKLDHDIIIIDEASMLGLDLWHNIIDAAKPSTRFILIGDLNQLKPVADATFFAYALSAGIDSTDGWSIAELTTIHRQKEPEANRIIEAAHAILNGKKIEFDDPGTNPNWRIIGFKLMPNATDAHKQVIGAVDYLRKLDTPGSPGRPVFDPYLDLLMTAGNGDKQLDSSDFIQQVPLNGSLSRVIEPPNEEHPVFIIDAGRDSKKFAVGHRVMATKNESPATKDRVTNGMTGRVTKIEKNPAWSGNHAHFGTEKEVMEWRSAHAKAMMAQAAAAAEGSPPPFSLGEINTAMLEAAEKSEERQASHIVTVAFVNGTSRSYKSAAEVAGIQLAYAITVHKAQGSQADTIILVVHHAVKRQLSREWLYTGVTRAKRRVVILYTEMGLSTAIARQQIFGSSLRDKVQRYRDTMETGRQFVRLRAREVSVARVDVEMEVEMEDDAAE